MEAIDRGTVDALLERVEAAVAAGDLPSAQVALARHGEVVVDATFGAADRARYVVFSISKALTAGAVWVLVSDGEVAPETPVAEIVPEFDHGLKRQVTVAHLLTHTAGFPHAPMRPEEGADPAVRRARFATWRIDWPPGTRTAYHPTSAHWVLADVVERVAGRPFAAFVAERVTGPLGLSDLAFGVDGDDVRDVTLVGAPPEPGSRGAEIAAAVAEIAPEILLRYNEPEVRRAGVPGAGAIGRAADVARYFQALLGDAPGVWDADVLADATGTIRNSLPDPVTGVPVNRTLGLVVAGDDGYAAVREVGDAVGPRTFAASGVGGQLAWADPDSGLSFCFLTDGIDRDVVRSFLRTHDVATLAGRCVASRSGSDR